MILPTIYIDPATIDRAYMQRAGVFPCASISRRCQKWEDTFEYGIYDAGIGDLATNGEYKNWKAWPPNPPLKKSWSWVAPDYPWDVLKECPTNKRTPQKCLEDTDANMEYYRKYITGGNALATVQFLFADKESLRVRLRGFLDEYGIAVFGIGNCCKLWKAGNIAQVAIGRVIVEVCARYECQPHVFGCPTRLLDYLVKHATFPFSVDTNKYHRGKLPGETESHLSRNINERTYFLHKYLIKHKLLDPRIIQDVTPPIPLPPKPKVRRVPDLEIKKRAWNQTTLF